MRESPLAQLTLARFREFFREPEAVFWVFIFPILLAAGLGVAFRNRPAEVLRVGLVGAAAPALDSALAGERALVVQRYGDAEGDRALSTGRVALLVVVGANGAVTYRYDDTRGEARSARLLADRAVQRAGGSRDVIATADDHIRQRGSRYIDFVVPGLLGMNLMGSGIWGVGFAIVDARKKRLLKRLVATPMSRAEYLGSFLLQRLALLIIEVGTLLGFGALVFHVPLRGSLALLALVCLLGSLCFSSIGLLLASRVRTIEGASGLMNLVMLPMWIFSGVFFAASNFPHAIQPVIQALPLTAVNDALRANMLEGAGWRSLAPEVGIIAAWLAVSFAAALKIFRWR